MSFQNLGLAPELLRALADAGYAEPTPIQAQAIPLVLEGRDVLAAAQTGTGKTAAFVLPILHRLASGPARSPRALVLVPTRELAAQVVESVETYGRHLRVRSAVIFGGVSINPQIERLRRGVDLIVATPGRLLDHAQQRTVDLSGIEMLVLDEADRMLDMGFIRDIRRLIALLPARRQNLLFSATFNDEIRALAQSLLNRPASVEVAPRNTTAAQITQRVHPVDKARKTALIAHLVTSGEWHQVLVFTRTKHGANRLAEQLARSGIETAAIHGNKSQNARTKALADFKDGRVRLLVATDIAARGIDIDGLPYVINHELPNVPEDYVPRIGRTGRAGSSGEAVSLVSGEEQPLLRDIQRLLRREIPASVIAGFEVGSAPLAGEIVAHPEAPRGPRPGQRPPRQNASNGAGAPRNRDDGRPARDRSSRPGDRRRVDAPGRRSR